MVRVFVVLVVTAAGLAFGALSGALYNPRPLVGLAGTVAGGLSGVAAGLLWTGQVVRWRRAGIAAGYCIAWGAGLGMMLGLASSFLVHLCLLIGSLGWPGQQRGDLFQAPTGVARWLAGPLPVGLVFGLGVGLAVGLVCASLLVAVVRRPTERAER